MKFSDGTLRKLLPVLPIVYLFVTVFFLRSHVWYFYGASVVLAILFVITIRKIKPESIKKFAYWLVALSVIGIAAATILTIEKVELLEDPDKITSCSLSPIVACSPVIGSEQASAFGFPNPVIGIFGFSAIFAAGMTLLSGSFKPSKGWWYALLGGAVFGVGFCIWLINAGLYDIKALCLYCLSVWIVTFTLFWHILTNMISHEIISLGPLNRITKKPLDPIILSLLILFVLVFLRWQEYWLSLL